MVKVEMKKDEATGVVALAFESSTSEELDVIDAVRMAIFSDLERNGGYVNSNRFVVHVRSK